MNNHNHISEELKEISPLISGIEKRNIFTILPDYFDEVSSIIMQKIKLSEKLSFYSSPSTPYIVPQNYFNNLPGNILQKAVSKYEQKSEVFLEMEEIAPFLNTIDKNPVYTTPENFFTNTVSQFEKKGDKGAKIIALKRTKKLSRYFAAAIIVALAAFGIFLITGKNLRASQSQLFNTRAAVKNLSEDEIIRFLKNNSSSENATSTSFNSTSQENEIKKSLKEMRDEDIEQFLRENREPGGI